MLLPTVACIPPRIAPLVGDDRAFVETNTRVLRNTTLVNFIDGCALSLPIHPVGGAPVGLMVAQLGGHDREVLAVGRSIEHAVARARGLA
jgi:aspartyl-tRNA(Asn)/glutamyl-tRNA(Gln) amidotransferase subunit A